MVLGFRLRGDMNCDVFYLFVIFIAFAVITCLSVIHSGVKCQRICFCFVFIICGN